MPDEKTTDRGTSRSSMARIVESNIAALITRRQQEEKARRRQAKIADSVTRITGSMTFVLIHVVGFGLWIGINLGWTPFPRFDPTFVVLAMFASVEAIFLSTFVLITQYRLLVLVVCRAVLVLLF